MREALLKLGFHSVEETAVGATTVKNEYQRMIREDINVDTTAVRFVPIDTYFSESLWTTYGSAQAHFFAFEVR